MTGKVKRITIAIVAVVSGEVACQESAPSLRLHVDGAADPSAVRIEYMLVGPFGGYRSQLRGSADYVDIPTVVSGQSAHSLKALVFCPGYRIIRVEIPDLATQAELRVALDPLQVRSLAGTVEFVGGTRSRSFVLDIDMTIPSAHQFFGIMDGAVTAFDVSEAVVSVEGVFSAAIADFAEDETLRTPGEPNVLQLRARDAVTRNFVFDLRPSEVALEDMPQTLVLSASPRP